MAKTAQVRSAKAFYLGLRIFGISGKAADSEATWEQNGIQRKGGASHNVELPRPPADLFIAAGAIAAERAARGGASRRRIEDILRRAVDQAAVLREAVP